MNSSSAYVSSQLLIDLQNSLVKLSGNLLECYSFIGQNINTVGESWRDEKFDEFVEEFHSSQEKVRQIGERYDEWAKRYLPPRIEYALEYEGANMGLGGSAPRQGGASDSSAEGTHDVSHKTKGLGLSGGSKADVFRRGEEKVNNLVNQKKQAQNDAIIKDRKKGDPNERGSRPYSLYSDEDRKKMESEESSNKILKGLFLNRER